MKNSILNHYNRIPGVQKYGNELSALCQQVYANAHPQAERQFLTIAEKLFVDSHGRQSPDQTLTTICDILYSEFNDYFLAWAREQGLQQPDRSQIFQFANYFLENAKEAEKLEDVIWELSSHIINYPRPENRDVIREKIQTLKKTLND